MRISGVNLARQLAGSGVFVEQAAMGVVFQQRLVFVLAVNVDQQLAQGLDVALGAGRAVDVAPRAPFGGDDPAQDAGAVRILVMTQVALGQPLARLRNPAEVEAGQQVGLVRTRTHHAVVGAIAEGQPQGVQHDRLAGTGFAGDHRHAGFEFEVEVFDDGVIVDRQVDQHADAPVRVTGYLYSGISSACKCSLAVSGAGCAPVGAMPLEAGDGAPI